MESAFRDRTSRPDCGGWREGTRAPSSPANDHKFRPPLQAVPEFTASAHCKCSLQVLVASARCKGSLPVLHASAPCPKVPCSTLNQMPCAIRKTAAFPPKSAALPLALFREICFLSPCAWRPRPPKRLSVARPEGFLKVRVARTRLLLLPACPEVSRQDFRMRKVRGPGGQKAPWMPQGGRTPSIDKKNTLLSQALRPR